MPQEGCTTVTIPTYRWEEAKEYFKKHSKELKKRGIKSASALVSYWVEQKLIEIARSEK